MYQFYVTYDLIELLIVCFLNSLASLYIYKFFLLNKLIIINFLYQMTKVNPRLNAKFLQQTQICGSCGTTRVIYFILKIISNFGKPA